MKKVLLPFLAVLFFISCEKGNINELTTEDQISENASVNSRSSNKRDVCHNGNIINININAIPAHQAHGDAVDMDQDGYFDIENPCSETDCDDGDAAVNPGAVEIPCNDIDDDCNPSTPDSSEEICDDGIDNDCDGNIDEADSDCVISCVNGELEVTLPDGSTLYVYPTDNETNIQWGEFGNDIDGLSNISTTASANADFNGETNTALIVADLGNWNGGDYAANLCATLSAETGCDWYLPAAGELNVMYQQLGPNGSGDIPNGFYWSSTELHAFSAFKLEFDFGGLSGDNKTTNFRCRCVRR